MKISKYCLNLLFIFWIVNFQFSFGTTYYVSTSGDDENNGISTSSPWKTLKKISRYSINPGFNAGDVIKFEGGSIFESDTSFYGSKLWVGSGGLIGSPIVYTSYGGMRATIKADTIGLYCKDKEFIEIRSLNFTSNYNPFNQSNTSFYNNIGIWFENSTNNKLKGILIDSCKVSRFLNTGISFVTDVSVSGGYENIKVINCKIDSIGHFGVFVSYYGVTYPFSNYPNKDISIINCEVSRVKGFSSSSIGTYTGTGILLIDVDSALIERNLVYSCGGMGYIAYGSGPDGIETAQCKKIIYQYNEAYDQKTSSETDGAGLHFGDGVQNSIMQYNYSHDNDGAGFNCFSYYSSYPLSDSNNVIRYNISAKNSRKCGDNHGEIEVGAGNQSTTYDIEIYNNTIYTIKNCGSDMAWIYLYRSLDSISIRNNVIICTDSTVSLIRYYPPVSSSSNTFLIQGNDYWSTKQFFKFQEGYSIYYSYTDWQSATGREKINNNNVGYTIDPLLLNPGNGGNVNNPYKLDTLNAYKSKPGSIIVENGINLHSLFGINIGSFDFYGTTIPTANEFDIGAYEDNSEFIIVDLNLYIQGFFNSISDSQVGDTIRLYLAESSSPYLVFDSSKSFVNSEGEGSFLFNTDILKDHGEDFFLIIKHRNSIETWSSESLYLIIPGGRVNFSFSIDSSKTYGNNIIKKSSKWCIYNGDVNQDGTIDASDYSFVENDSGNSLSGYVVSDLTGDNFVDAEDVSLIDNNILLGVSSITP